MKAHWSLPICIGSMSCLAGAAPQGSTGDLDRNHLPNPRPTVTPITVMDARDVSQPARFEVKAPTDAPNVVIVLIDDIGLGATSTFGGGIHTPPFDRLADGGGR